MSSSISTAWATARRVPSPTASRHLSNERQMHATGTSAVAYVLPSSMSTIGLRELRQNASDFVRRAEAGEEIIVTVSGRPSVRIIAVAPKAWRSYSEIESLFSGRPDTEWESDRDRIDQDARDPWSGA
jgi:prevent-host-death family protein